MKNRKFLILNLIFIFLIFSCSGAEIIESLTGEKYFSLTEDEKFKNNLKKYNLEAKIITSKGELKMYLYPEAAPKLVANFVYLSRIGYYDNLPFHRVNVNDIIQSGDRKGDGSGTPGYLLKDEFSFLRFDRSGVVAMANYGPDTNGSQFFITLQTNSHYNNNYSIIGNLKIEDLSTARLIRQNDTIKTIEISGVNVDSFLDNFKDDIKIWNDKIIENGFELKNKNKN